MITFRLGRPGINLFDPKKILFFLWLFLLVFPKGGFKIGGVPITWGYLLLGVVSFFIHAIRTDFRLSNARFFSFILLLPFQMVSIGHLIFNGSAAGNGMTISFLINFFFLPYVFFLLFSQHPEQQNKDRLFILIKNGVFLISFYGIFLFIYKQTTSKFIEIPLLTTNLSDLGALEEKCINRGFAFKLISTYNNGNLYGICLLMLLPLYCYLEPLFWRRAIVKTSLLLTLSRTVWIGLLFHEICYHCFVSKKGNRGHFLISSSLFILATTIMAAYYDFSLIDFVFDAGLGGRQNQLAFFKEFTLLSSNAFEGISEIVYAGVIHSFGILGLITFMIAMCGPLLVRSMKRPLTPFHKSLFLGMTNYLLISCSDGGMLFIPVMAFYWFLGSLLVSERTPSAALSFLQSVPSPSATALSSR